MKCIIAGSRSITDIALVRKAFFVAPFSVRVSEIVSGGADGVDSIAELLAAEIGVPVCRFLPDWAEYGRYAGPKRNAEMAKYADCLVLVWDGVSAGSASMLREAKKAGLEIHVLTTAQTLF